MSAPILFFDGTCGFCTRSVQWVLRHDRRTTLRFAPLQGQTYAALDLPGKPTDMSSLVLLRDGRLFTRSSATVRMLRLLGGIWPLIGALLWLIPKPLRDWGYRLVARNRYKIAGRADACMLPTPDQSARMLP
jgi:predicted DCC family thiol-disulfide oxidoreductase YuxK